MFSFRENRIFHFTQIVTCGDFMQIVSSGEKCLQWRQFAWKVKSYFLGKTKKISPICRLLDLPREWKGLNAYPCQRFWTYFDRTEELILRVKKKQQQKKKKKKKKKTRQFYLGLSNECKLWWIHKHIYSINQSAIHHSESRDFDKTQLFVDSCRLSTVSSSTQPGIRKTGLISYIYSSY